MSLPSSTKKISHKFIIVMGLDAWPPKQVISFTTSPVCHLLVSRVFCFFVKEAIDIN